MRGNSPDRRETSARSVVRCGREDATPQIQRVTERKKLVLLFNERPEVVRRLLQK